jgi:hypothetical protein
MVVSRHRLVLGALQLATAAGLVIDGIVHLRDAPDYEPVQGILIGEDTLFRAQAVVALVLALLLLLWPRLWVWALAALTAAAAAGAVILYTYVDLGAIAGLPNMYEPTWLPPGKLVSAVAEATTAVLAVAGFLVTWRAGRNQDRTPTR